jgi:hypothetical protein
MERGDYVKVRALAGVACVFLGPGRVWEQTTVLVENEDGEEVEHEIPGDGEWVPDESVARVRMVGDDTVYEVDPDDCKPLDESEFCGSCGQMGCSHGRQ